MKMTMLKDLSQESTELYRGTTAWYELYLKLTGQKPGYINEKSLTGPRIVKLFPNDPPDQVVELLVGKSYTFVNCR